MEIRKIVDYVNRAFIASDYLREPDIYYYMDLVIDDINERLQARFPNFTDWLDFVASWNAWVAGPNPIMDDREPLVPPAPKPLPAGKEPKHIHPHPIPGYPHLPIEHVPGMEPKPRLRDNKVYDAFPDEYIRTVLALGVAVKFYTRDEEGEAIAADYQNRYEMALFKMQRDYMNQVPWYFQDNTGGYIDFSYVWEEGPRNLNPRGMVIHGYNGKNL